MRRFGTLVRRLVLFVTGCFCFCFGCCWCPYVRQAMTVPALGSDTAIGFKGNKVSVLSTKDLRELLRSPQTGTRCLFVVHPSVDADVLFFFFFWTWQTERFVLQKLIKCRGNQAFIHRCCVQDDQYPTGFVISNRCVFTDEDVPIVERFCTQPSVPLSATVFPLSNLGVRPTYVNCTT